MCTRAIIRVYYKANGIDVNVYMFRIFRDMYVEKSSQKTTLYDEPYAYPYPVSP